MYIYKKNKEEEGNSESGECTVIIQEKKYIMCFSSECKLKRITESYLKKERK